MILVALFATRILLPSRQMIEPVKNGRVSKQPATWYYVKCPKNVTNCGQEIISILKSDPKTSIIPMSRDIFAVYFTREEAQQAVADGLKFQKIPKNQKSDKTPLADGSNQYLVITSGNCELPFFSREVGLQGQLIESDKDPKEVFEILKRIPCVRTYEQLPYPRLNTRFTRSLSHVDNATKYLHASGYPWGMRNVFNERGIGGHGQVASIVDTGLDSKSCWFIDHDQEKMAYEDSTGMDHRKVVSYFRYGDDHDATSGHGTFISSIILGSANCGEEETQCAGKYYDGVAPSARIIVNDVFKEGDNRIRWPSNITDLFLIPRFMSAAVQYHGFDFKMKSYFTYLMDQIAFFFPQMLLLFAAGDGKGEDSKVTSPGDSKNVLTVGATKTTGFALNQLDPATPIIVICNEVEYIGYCDAFAGITWMEAMTQDEFFMKPYDTFVIGNDKQQVGMDIDGDDSDITRFAKHSVVLAFHTKSYNGTIKRPVIRLPAATASEFSDGSTIKLAPFAENDKRHIDFTEESVAPISRRGPVKYMRNKPEIVMPGGPVLGANANIGGGSCGRSALRLGEGSSVAAAFATGDILLLRQYLKHGYYPSGEKSREDVIKTSNHLLRTILVNIARPVKGDKHAAGWGMPRLDKFIMFKDQKMKKDYGIRLFRDNISSNRYHTYAFIPESDGTLRVTIGWNDPPHDPLSPSDVLFRLDVRVEDTSDGTTRIGNRSPDDYPSTDVHNTIKHITMKVKKDVRYLVHVVSGSILYFNNCSYSLAISGPFKHFGGRIPYRVPGNGPSPKCSTGCEGGASCVNGWCQCPPDRYGDLCSFQRHLIKDGLKHEEDPLRPHEWVFLSYKFGEWKDGSYLDITLNYDTSKKLLYMFAINEVPRWEFAHCTSDRCDWVTKTATGIRLDYVDWEFLQEGDTLQFAIYSYDTAEFPVTVSFQSNHQ